VSYALSAEASAQVPATADALFAFLDDPRSLGAHMEKPSAMMLGGSMRYAFDAGGGQAIGSVISMKGNVLGLSLTLDEVVTERSPPTRKVWETRGAPDLRVIGPYRMGFEIAPHGERSQVRVFIDFSLPQRGLSQLLGAWFGRGYARWCVVRMAKDAERHFKQGR
jgi:hypothetical protein